MFERSSIERACIEIAYDNGMIYRGGPSQDEVVKGMIQNIVDAYPSWDIISVEKELDSLGYEGFIAACTDPINADISPLCNEMLDVVFEGM